MLVLLPPARESRQTTMAPPAPSEVMRAKLSNPGPLLSRTPVESNSRAPDALTRWEWTPIGPFQATMAPFAPSDTAHGSYALDCGTPSATPLVSQSAAPEGLNRCA